MKALVIGGPRDREWIEVPDGLAMWIDLAHGDSLPVAYIRWDTVADGAHRRYRLPVAVHPSMAADIAAVQNAVIALAMTAFMEAHVPAEDLPTPPQVVVPDSPATLFGADGRPLGGAR